MYVCICHAVSEAEVRAEIAAGASTEDEVGERCRAGTGCGGCLDRICDLLGEGAGPPAPPCVRAARVAATARSA